MKILFLTAGDEAHASSRVRVYQYLPYLKELNIEYIIQPNSSSLLIKHYEGLQNYGFREPLYIIGNMFKSKMRRLMQILFHAYKYDIIFVQRDFLSIYGFSLAGILKKMNPNIIYDFDDAVFTFRSVYFKNLKKRKIKRKIEGKKRKWIKILRSAKYVTVGNKYLESFTSKYMKNVFIIPSVIDIKKYQPKRDNKETSNGVTIGWMGSISTSLYLTLLINVFRKLSIKYRNLRFYFVGAPKIKIEGISMKVKNWNLDSEIKDLQEFDIGIAPLPDNEWTRGKCGYKLLQYMGVGIPSVASPVGVNKEIVMEGVNGYLASSENEWFSKLSILIENKDLRIKMGKEGRRLVEQKYSIKNNVNKFIRILNRCVS